MSNCIKEPIIVLTMDYELFGNGDGDVKKLMIEPTERLLNILKRKNIKMTVFFEIEEYLNFKKNRTELIRINGYDPVYLIESQLKKIIKEKHEIGLHIHPQWINAVFDGQRFKVNLENYTLSKIYSNYNRLKGYLQDRYLKLSALVNEINSDYKITSYRAGGFAIQPEKLTLKILSTLGINADSSVVKGYYKKNKYMDIDYRNTPLFKNIWQINDSVCKAEKNGKIIELPIYSEMLPEYKKLSLNRVLCKYIFPTKRLFLKQKTITELSSKRNLSGIVSRILRKSPMKFDYCHMSANEMEKILSNIKFSRDRRSIYPLIAIGHSKEFFNDKNLDKFLCIALKKYNVKFLTVNQMKNYFYHA